MTTQTDFTADEWQLIQKTLHEPGAAVMLASPGGQWSEFFAIAKAMMEAPAKFQGHELVQSLLTQAGSGAPSAIAKSESGDFMDQVIRHLRQAVKLVEGKASDGEVEAYKDLVMYIAEKIANAAREGDTPVSDEEQRVLDEIRLALHRKA